MGRMARVNPTTVSTPRLAQENCPLGADHKADAPLSIDLSCFRFPDRAAEPDAAPAYQLAVRGPEGERTYHRNRLQEILVNHANSICQEEKGRIYANKAASAALFDIVSSGLSITSAIVTGDTAKSILSGGAGFATSTRNSIDASVYQNQIVPAITKVMDTERKRILDLLLAKGSEPVAQFTPDEMIRTVNQYHQACSFERGIQLLLDAAINKEGAEAVVRNANLSQTVDQLSRQIVAARTRGGTEGEETAAQLERKLREILLQQGVEAQTSTTPTQPLAAAPAPAPVPSVPED